MLRRSIVLAAIAMAGFTVGQPGAAFAHMHEHDRGNVQALRDASNALKQSNPALAQKLSDYADREAREREEWSKMREQKEQAEAGDVQLLRDSASALKQSDPKLARKLASFAEKEEEHHQRWEHKREWQEKHEEHHGKATQNFKP